MARERLTSRARQSADDKTPYPGSINQEGRVEEGRGSMTYRTFEPSVENHEGLDTGWVHENDENRNEMHVGIPDPASNTLITASDEGNEADFQRKCLKAAQCAELVLGEKVADRVLLAQARDFLALDEETLDRTIERFNRTEQLYAAEDKEEEKEEKKEGKKDEKPAESAPVAPAAPAPEPVALPKAPAAPAPTVAAKEEKKEEVKEEKAEGKKETPPVDADGKFCKASKARALNLARLAARTLPVNECTRENIAKQTEKFASMNDEVLALALIAAGEQPVVDDACTAPVAAKEEKKEEKEEPKVEHSEVPAGPMAPQPIASVSESDFDLSGEFNDGPVTANAAADAELASIFSDPMIDAVYAPSMQASINDSITASVEEPRARTAKVGVRSVGGKVAAPAQEQPVSSNDELGSLWKDAPDVNSFFTSI
jgi:hypothetical protein